MASKKIEIKVKEPGEEKYRLVEIDGYSCPRAPGLFAHRMYPQKDTWALTHVPSGRKIPDVYFETRELAFECAEALAHVIDWDQPANEIIAAGVGKEIHMVLEKYRHLFEER